MQPRPAALVYQVPLVHGENFTREVLKSCSFWPVWFGSLLRFLQLEFLAGTCEKVRLHRRIQGLFGLAPWGRVSHEP